MNIIYRNNCYYMLGSNNNDVIVNEDNQINFELINLTNKSVIPIRNESFFGNNLINKIYGEISIEKFRSNVKSFGDDYFCVCVVASYIPELENGLADRLYYRIKSIEPFEIEYMDICIPSTRGISFYEDDIKYYVITNPFTRDVDIDGLDIFTFDKKTKNLINCISIENTNQLFMQHRNNEIWISMNGYKYIGNNQITKLAVPEICKFNQTTEEVIIYSNNSEEHLLK